MELLMEVRAAIRAGFEPFKKKINAKLTRDKNYLDCVFWQKDGTQKTILNYLISLHLEQDGEGPEVDLTQFIDFIVDKAADKNLGEPVHQAILTGKYDLAVHLLDLEVFNVNLRDMQGNTLLSLALATKNESLIRAIFRAQPNVQLAALRDNGAVFLPLHEAVDYDFALAIHCLAQAGARLDNPVGPLGDTPVLLAARRGKINALTALLEQDEQALKLGAKTKKGANAVDLLSLLLKKGNKQGNLLKGIAMLLCHGEEPPHSKELCQLLTNNRKKLLSEVDEYLKDRPALVDTFVARCHEQSNPLHKILYEESSWGHAWNTFFGKPSPIAFKIEQLVSRKHEIKEKAATKFVGNESPLVLYAEFVRRYEATYASERITNPWSSMRWMIASGKCGWEVVLGYATKYPKTRTGLIISEMLNKSAEQQYDKVHSHAEAVPEVPNTLN